MVHVIGLHRSTLKLFSHHLGPLFRSNGSENAIIFKHNSITLCRGAEEPKLNCLLEPQPKLRIAIRPKLRLLSIYNRLEEI